MSQDPPAVPPERPVPKPGAAPAAPVPVPAPAVVVKAAPAPAPTGRGTRVGALVIAVLIIASLVLYFVGDRFTPSTSQARVQATRRALDIATIQYREGLVDFQRVLDSQRALFSAQERLVTSQGGVVQYLIAVYKAIGGGWHAGRSRAVVDDATRTTMEERSDWKSLLQAPLPPPSAEFPPPPASDTP